MKTNSILKPAHPENQICSDNVRISILEPRLIRFEWSKNGLFEDRKTQNVTCRNFGAVHFLQKEKDNGMEIDTGALKIFIGKSSKDGFSAQNLSIEFPDGKQWHYGDPETENLGGTCTEFDMLDGENHIALESWLANDWKIDRQTDLGKGLLSRSGWSVFDDTETPTFREEPFWGEWIDLREQNNDRKDFYFFGFGHDYKAALARGADLFGPLTKMPRFAFGYWYSRYWAYDQRELEEIREYFDRTQTPLDVLGIDMDWHKPGWTNFTWDYDFLPNPVKFLAELKADGIMTTFNLHPGDLCRDEPGFEDADQFFKINEDGKIIFDLESPTFMKRYFDALIHPKEDDGVNFWWIDMREGGKNGYSKINWMNHLHYLDHVRRSTEERPMLLACRGGMGGCRYPAGFSADTCSTWATLKKEVQLTATAANVLFGCWSHDLGGHMEATPNTPELNLRWMQFGCFSPIMRSHSAKFEYAERRFWEFPAPWNKLMRDTILKRYEIMPYLYSEYMAATASGLSLCRPLYHEYPEVPEAYQHPDEYFFGSQMIAAPVTVPEDPQTHLASSAVWLPAGDWYDIASGRLLTGPVLRSIPRMREEIPLFVRAGAIIPEAVGSLRAGKGVVEHLQLSVFPGDQGSYSLYEDDGHSLRCDSGEKVLTPVCQFVQGKTRTIIISPASGRCSGWQKERHVSLKLFGCIPPESVSVNGQEFHWRYDGYHFTTLIDLGTIDTEKTYTILVNYSSSDFTGVVAGMPGIIRRIERIARIQNTVAGCFAPVKDDRLGQHLLSSASRISACPQKCVDEIQHLKELYPRLEPSLRELHRVRSARFPFSLKEGLVLLDEIRKEFL